MGTAIAAGIVALAAAFVVLGLANRWLGRESTFG